MQFKISLSLLLVAVTSSVAAPAGGVRAVIPFIGGYADEAKRDVVIPFGGAYEDAESEDKRRSVIPFESGYEVEKRALIPFTQGYDDDQ